MGGSLNQRDQRTAQRILHDIESGDLRLSPGKTIYDYILDYGNVKVNYTNVNGYTVQVTDLASEKTTFINNPKSENYMWSETYPHIPHALL